MGAFTKGLGVDPAKLKRAKVALPEIGPDTFICVRELTAREAIGASGATKDNPLDGFTMIAIATVNEDGSPIFTDGEDVRANLDVSAATIRRLVDKICELSGLDTINLKN